MPTLPVDTLVEHPDTEMPVTSGARIRWWGTSPGSIPTHLCRTLAVMTTSPGARRRHLASSPFTPDPEPIIESYAVEDLVSHDSYGLGRVTGADAGGVTVDFRTHTVRITSPFQKMDKL